MLGNILREITVGKFVNIIPVLLSIIKDNC